MNNLHDVLPQFMIIPAGRVLMGTPERELSALAKAYGGTRESYREESPQHQVTLAAFAIAVTPITNALYAHFVAATGARPPLFWRGTQAPADRLDHPVVDISWYEARQCCTWLSEQVAAADLGIAADTQGSLRLPSEAEWERAARGDDGRRFPWGDEFRPERANTREGERAATSPVGAYTAGASPWGVLDLAGNVWEWTESLDGLYPYRADDGREGSGSGRRILRGGCYANPHGFARCACRFRMAPQMRNDFIGFRPAISIKEPAV